MANTKAILETETLTHSQLMAKRDGAVRFWTVMPGASAKLVRDGVSFARIDALTDGTVWCKLNDNRRQLGSWDEACFWIEAQMRAAALEGVVWI